MRAFYFELPPDLWFLKTWQVELGMPAHSSERVAKWAKVFPGEKRLGMVHAEVSQELVDIAS